MKFIALLKGINVGGNKKILMKDLKEMMISMGFSNVKTYIQSGNVVFDADQNSNSRSLQTDIENQIEKRFGFIVSTLVLDANFFQLMVGNNPFESTDLKQLHLTFFHSETNTKLVEMDTEDQITIHPFYAYIKCVGKYNDTPYTNQFLEKNLKVIATTRNWNTILQISKMLDI